MAVSLNSVVSFSSMNLQPNYKYQSRAQARISAIFKETQLASTLWSAKSSRSTRTTFRNSASDGDQLAVDTSDKDSASPLESVEDASVRSNGSVPKPEPDAESGNSKSPRSSPKRSPLTARERLRAARVLSRYAETKSLSKSEMGRKVLDASKESDRGKRRSGLPEAPTNLFDDSKRGLPKEGFTFQFPGGFDLFIVAFSFVFISTIMFATTYLVWKVGAIHFNES